MRALALLTGVLALSGCVDKDGAYKALDEQGYSQIVLGDHTPFFNGCGDDDVYATPFTAVSLAGRQVQGVVCAGGGWGKGSTIRTF